MSLTERAVSSKSLWNFHSYTFVMIIGILACFFRLLRKKGNIIIKIRMALRIKFYSREALIWEEFYWINLKIFCFLSRYPD
jgi:hypothetical protein